MWSFYLKVIIAFVKLNLAVVLISLLQWLFPDLGDSQTEKYVFA